MPKSRKHVRFDSSPTLINPSTPSASHSIPPVPSSSVSHTPSSVSTALPEFGHPKWRSRGKRSPPPSVPSSSGSHIPPSVSTATPGSYLSNHPRSHSKPKRSPLSSVPVPTHVHRLLEYSHHPVIDYDVRLSPSTITTSYKHLSTSLFSEPATSPPVSSLVIQIPHHSWPISVHASSKGQYVTVSDVFDAIYRALRKTISPSEYRAIPSRKDAETVQKAYTTRCGRHHDRRAYERERWHGVKRVDFLSGRTHFMGLSSAGRGSGAWVLSLS